MLLHLNLHHFRQVVEVSDKGRHCAMHLIIVCKAEFKELQPISNHRTICYLRAIFLYYATVDIVDIEVEAGVISIPLERTQIKRLKSELWRAFLQCSSVWRGFASTRISFSKKAWGGV